MYSLFSTLLIVSVSYNRIYCNSVTPSENLRMVRRPQEVITVKSDEDQTQEKQISFRSLLFPAIRSAEKEGLNENVHVKSSSANRKSKILNSLAFLAGLGVGGLAGAASTSVKTYANDPPATLNFSALRLSPHFAAIYDPFFYMSQPYMFLPPLRRYTLWDILQSQSIDGTQNTVQPLMQNPQLVQLINNKQPSDVIDNNNDEDMEEAKKVETVKISSNAVEKIEESTTLRVKDDWNAETKSLKSDAACGTQDVSSKQDNLLKSASNIHEDVDGSLKSPSFRAANKTGYDKANKNQTDTMSVNETNASTTMAPKENSTMSTNETTTPPFHGYYGGYPQDINYIDFTTETTEHKYHDFEYSNHNLPPYDKPANFYPDEKNNYYANPPVNFYPQTQYHQDHVPEFVSNDFNKFLYTPENTPPFYNGFRPVL